MSYHIEEKPNGFYWKDDNTKQTVGPFRTADDARYDRYKEFSKQSSDFHTKGIRPTISFVSIVSPMAAKR